MAIAKIVQRFMGAGQPPTSVQPSAERKEAGASPSVKESATPRPVDFVSEDDVKAAIKKGQKIYIGAHTIVTPSARDLAEPNEVFVLIK